MNEAERRLAEEIVRGEGVHQIGTLSPGKIRILELIHSFSDPVGLHELATASGWTTNYVYRLVNELTLAGILEAHSVESPTPRRTRRHYRCICSTTQEGEA